MNDKEAMTILGNLEQRYAKQWTDNEKTAFGLAMYSLNRQIEREERQRRETMEKLAKNK